MKHTSLEVAVIIPCHNRASDLKQCLEALAATDLKNIECIVVDDASTDESAEVALAASFPVRLLRMSRQRGPGAARNAAARATHADILVFLDADVTVYAETLPAICAAFTEDPDLGALLGAYDDSPKAPGFYSQYRNLLHCYVHRTASRRATTFWSGCGAIRRDIFWAGGGFDETPGGVEDIEFGGRAARAGVRMELRPEIQVKHLKAWTFFSTLRTDVTVRAVPWTLIILRDRRMPNTLNIDYRNRLSVALIWLALLVLASSASGIAGPLAALACLAVAVYANRGFYAFLQRRRGTRFALQGVTAHLLHLFVCGGSFLFGVLLYATGRGLPARVGPLPAQAIQRELVARASGD